MGKKGKEPGKAKPTLFGGGEPRLRKTEGKKLFGTPELGAKKTVPTGKTEGRVDKGGEQLQITFLSRKTRRRCKMDP